MTKALTPLKGAHPIKGAHQRRSTLSKVSAFGVSTTLYDLLSKGAQILRGYPFKGAHLSKDVSAFGPTAVPQ